MHEAFLPICLLRNYPYTLECLTCYDNFIIVGTKQGLLLVYEVTPNTLNHPTYFVPQIIPRLPPSKSIPLNCDGAVQNEEEHNAVPPSFSLRVHTTRTLGECPISQLAAIPELDLLLAITEGQLKVYQLQNCQLISAVPKSKGASMFTHLLLTDSNSKTRRSDMSPRSESFRSSTTSVGSFHKTSTLHLCVAVKRRLMFWHWDPLKQNFLPGSEIHVASESLPEISLPDTARALQFCCLVHVLVGTRTDYMQVNIRTGELKSIAAPGRNQLPLIQFLSGCFQELQPLPDVDDICDLSILNHPTPGNRRDSSFQSCRSPATNDLPSTKHSWLAHSTSIAIGQDSALLLTHHEPHGASPSRVSWSHSPHRLHVYPPYVLGVLDQCIEVRTLDPCELVQQIPIPQVQSLCHHGGWLYLSTAPAAREPVRRLSGQNSPRPAHSPERLPPVKPSGSGNEIWLLLSANRSSLLNELVDRKEFEAALLLNSTAFLTGQAAGDNRKIASLYAYHLCVQQNFDHAMKLFIQYLIDPSHVMGLFSDLNSDLLRPDINYPSGHTAFDNDHFVRAAEPLITFLLTWRRLARRALSLDRSFNANQSSIPNPKPSADVLIRVYPLVEGSPTVESGADLLAIIDTSLLKCYLATNTARVAPLLRQSNSCDLGESEKTLLQHHRYQDLVMLYQTHGLHQKALSVLQQFGLSALKNQPGSPPTDTSVMSGGDHVMVVVDISRVIPSEVATLGHPRQTVRYLQQLDPSHFGLVANYAGWIMQQHPMEWMRIFIAWEQRLSRNRRAKFQKSENLGSETKAPLAYRNLVLKYLEHEAPHLLIPFLECLIFTKLEGDEASSGTDDESEDESDMEDKSAAESSIFPVDFFASPEVRNSSSPNQSSTSGSSSLDQHDSLWPLPGSKRSKDPTGFNDPDALPPIVLHPDDTNPMELHTRYAAALMNRARSLQPPGKPFACRVADELPKLGPVARLRRRLFRFLNHPGATYSSRKLLDNCPYDSMFEERTLLLANLNQHEHALTMWVHVLDDWNRALSHCYNVHQRFWHATNRDPMSGVVTTGFPRPSASHRLVPTNIHSRSSLHGSACRGSDDGSLLSTAHSLMDDAISGSPRDIFFLLFKICLQPPEPASLGIIIPGQKFISSFSPKPDRALEVLHRFSEHVDAVNALRILTTTKFHCVADFFRSALVRQEGQRSHLVFLNNAVKAELSASRQSLIMTTKQKFTVSNSSLCRTCRRRIGTSVFVRHPSSGELEHYGCCRGLADSH